MSAVSYAFAVGNVRAKESALLKKQDVEQMLSLDSVSEICEFLRDKGFADADTPLDISLILSAEERKTWEYAASVAPDFSVFEAFIVPNDYHNIKAILKGSIACIDVEGLLLRPCTVEPELIKKAVSEQEFTLLPTPLGDVAAKAYEALVKAGDPQLCDALLDASCSAAKLSLVEKVKIPMLCEMVRANVFFDNAKAAIRCARANKSADFCDSCLTDTDKLTKKQFRDAALKGVDDVLELISTVSEYRGSELAEAYKVSPAEFERFADNFILSVALKARYVAVGAEPLVAYLQAKLTEIKVCRSIANGREIGEEAEKTREMLRELYG